MRRRYNSQRYFDTAQLDQRTRNGSLVGHFIGTGSGNSIKNLARSNFNGVLNGSTRTWVVGQDGKRPAVFYGGTDAWLDMGQLTGDTIPFTGAFWVKIRSGDAGGNYLCRGSDGFGAGWSVATVIVPNSVASLYLVLAGAMYTVSGTTSILPDTWYHIAVTWTPGVNFRIFVNGKLEGTTSNGNTTLRSSSVGWTCAFINGGYSKGFVDDIRIYNTVLSDAQIATLGSANYNSIIPVNYRSPYTTVTSLIKTKKGLAQASIKTFKGLANASVKTNKGLSNV